MHGMGEGVSYVTSADERQRLARLRYFRRDNPSAAGRFAAVAATRFRTGTGGRAVAGITAKLDMIVAGLRSVPPHPEVETVMVGGVGHLGMLLSRHVVGRVSRRACRLGIGRQSRLSMLVSRMCVTVSRAAKNAVAHY